ncbi:hypothetical protein CALCODRAFT_478904 [Calocera cornea HHB12733]|uniref:Ribosomal protein L9 domain-containing protein n=1 Tax=Calocera cornea HHB12733 TaxID=1353952 RepID=A0A165K2X8_9BASI|nr:hypothetical protein CALCODRAFT_478904 [Calocera cornea HHB12733]
MHVLARALRTAHPPPAPPLTRALYRRGRNTKSKHGVLVRLLQDVPTLGKRGAVLEVPRQEMRAWYFPQQRAEYVLRPMGGFRLGDLVSTGVRVPGALAEPPLPTPLAEAALRTPSLSPLLPVLQALPPLTFTRRPISPSSPELFGSVTASHILALLAAEHGVRLDPGQCTVRLEGDAVVMNRVKALGHATATVVLQGVGQAELRIVVVPPDEGDVVEVIREEEEELAPEAPAQPVGQQAEAPNLDEPKVQV